MIIVPLISVKKGDLYDGINGSVLSLDELFTKTEKDAMVYVLDYDGVDHRNPNLELYQKLTEHCVLWIDNGPRRIDDVMDTIMAGATNLSLRPNLWPDMVLQEVFELTDDEVYLTLASPRQEPPFSFAQGITGIVLFSQDQSDVITTHSVRETTPLKTYLYTASSATIGYWEERGITGLLVDLSKKEGYDHGV
jgi:hypothetical protein